MTAPALPQFWSVSILSLSLHSNYILFPHFNPVSWMFASVEQPHNRSTPIYSLSLSDKRYASVTVCSHTQKNRYLFSSFIQLFLFSCLLSLSLSLFLFLFLSFFLTCSPWYLLLLLPVCIPVVSCPVRRPFSFSRFQFLNN